MTLRDLLTWTASRWVEEQRRVGFAVSLKTLSWRATNDSKLFKRLACGAPIHLKTLEACMSFLDASRNWPQSVLPNDVSKRLSEVGISFGDRSDDLALVAPPSPVSAGGEAPQDAL